jgi:hypothetical protein
MKKTNLRLDMPYNDDFKEHFEKLCQIKIRK